MLKRTQAAPSSMKGQLKSTIVRLPVWKLQMSGLLRDLASAASVFACSASSHRLGALAPCLVGGKMGLMLGGWFPA